VAVVLSSVMTSVAATSVPLWSSIVTSWPMDDGLSKSTVTWPAFALRDFSS
jgi:hypothetical protein